MPCGQGWRARDDSRGSVHRTRNHCVGPVGLCAGHAMIPKGMWTLLGIVACHLV